MKTTKLMAAVALIALVLFLVVPSLSWAAEDGAALYKAKCAMCHKPDGSGNPALKAPAIKGSDKVAATIASNPKHAALQKALTPAQVAAIADYVKGMK